MPSARFGPLALSIVAGAALPLAFAPVSWWWLAPFCYAALFHAWRDATPKQAFRRGFVFGFAEFLLGIYWIVISVHEYGGAPVGIALFLMLGLVTVMALYPALVGWAAVRWLAQPLVAATGSGNASAAAGLGPRPALALLGTVPALFVVAEWIRGWFLTGFGWLAPGYTQTDSWLAGFAPLLGVHGVSWALLVLAGGVALAVRGTGRERFAATAVAVAIVAAAFVTDRIRWTEAKPAPLSVALAQGAVSQEFRWVPEHLPESLALYRALTSDALGSDLIVWPEAAIPDLYENVRGYFAEIEALAAAGGSELMTGALRYHAPSGRAQNVLMTLGQPETVYVKRHLVPYGEYFPVPEFIEPWLSSMNILFPDLEPGEPDQPVIELLGERIAVTICYEDVFGAEQLYAFPDASLMINVSNDAWFGRSIAADQHLQIARMRSLEVRRPQLRATNTGITAVIDPFGRVVDALPPFEPGVLRATVTGVTGTTPYIF
ncbi:MAG: apolipoprotein N-acyltransferase, partial [Gammaproteobacteria bacterium]|nr:apolipoprotein N-acyltransferase [Gammaproteobacteria bacterium]